MTRLLSLLAVLVLATGFVAEARGQSESRPNVLLIMTDDQRAGAYATMPDTMRLFREGGRHYPNAIATTPLCCPSRASFMTGRFAHNHGVTLLTNPENLDQATTLQYQLGQAGYRTGLVGKYLNAWNDRPIPHFGFEANRAQPYYLDGTYTTTVNRKAAISFLNSSENEDARPWMLFITVFAPHEPAIPEGKYADAPVPKFTGNPAHNETDRSDKPPYVREQHWSKAEVAPIRADMFRTLYSVDDLVQAVFARMDVLGEQDTIAFFTSDNGYMWAEHGLRQKRHAYDESVKVPMFVRWPGRVPAGSRDTTLAANIDIAPTIYEATGVTPNHVMDGRSLLAPRSRAYVLMEEWDAPVPWRGLWSPTESYIEYNDGFQEDYGADDLWQLTNDFLDDEPGNEAQLHDLLEQQSGCAGTSCL